jgi:hypothetical protein
MRQHCGNLSQYEFTPISFDHPLMLSARSEWCTTLYLRTGMLIMWDVLIRCNYSGWAPLQVVNTELTNGSR